MTSIGGNTPEAVKISDSAIHRRALRTKMPSARKKSPRPKGGGTPVVPRSESSSSLHAVFTHTKLFCWRTFLALLALLAWVFFRLATVNNGYPLEMIKFAAGGMGNAAGMRHFFRERVDESNGQWLGPGANAITYASHADVSTRLAELPEQVGKDKWKRHNNLGFQHLNSFFWSSPNTGPKQIGLGIGSKDHALVRPILSFLDPTMGEWSKNNSAMIEKHLSAFFQKDAITTTSGPNSGKVAIMRLLFEIHLGRTISEAEALELLSFQQTALVAIAVPQYIVDIFGDMLGTWICDGLFGSIRDTRHRYFSEFETDLMTHLPADNFANKSPSERQLITSSVMDSVLFTGGVSVPSMMAMSVALMVDAGANTKFAGLKNFQLTESNAGEAVWETIRRFPPVGALSYTSNEKKIFLNLFMAAQDPSVFSDPDEWKLRGIHAYKKSVMFGDYALQGGSNLAPHSHACPAKALSMQILTRFLKHFSKHAWTSETTDVGINEYGAKDVKLRKQRGTDCQAERDAGRRCINYVNEEGRVVAKPGPPYTHFDGECFTHGKAQPKCITYNRASWAWGFFAAYLLAVAPKDLLQWKLPVAGFLLYSGFRVTETFNAPMAFNHFIGNPLYALAMYWGHMCYSEDSLPQSVAKVYGCVFALYAVLSTTLSSESRDMAYQASFLPFYLYSLKTLWQNDAKIWCIGLSWGWLGPLVIVFSGICSDADPSVYGTPFVSNASGECVYDWLMLSDGCITFPLAFAGQLIVSARRRT